MLDNALYVHGYMRDKTSDDLMNRTDVRFVVERGLQNVGEAAFQLRRIAPDILTGVHEYERIIGMRHLLVHGYDEVNPGVLWNVVNTKIGLLVEDLRHMIESMDDTTP